jgi:hypothetical protein
MRELAVADAPVRPPVALLTELDARELLAKPLLSLCSDHGPTRVGKALGGVNEKTVRDARDEKSTLSLDTAVNLLSLDPHALDGFLGHFGRRSVPADAVCSTDALPAMTGAVHKLVLASAPTSVDGQALSKCELLGAKAEIRQAFDALATLLTRIDRIERGEAA